MPIDESLPTSGRDNGMAQPDFDLWNGANTSGDGIDLAKLFACLRAIRCGTLLEPGQVAAYAATLQTSNSLVGLGEEEVRPPSSTDHSDAVALAARMTLIAEVAGEPDEVAFWEGLVPTLASLRDRCTRPSPRCVLAAAATTGLPRVHVAWAILGDFFGRGANCSGKGHGEARRGAPGPSPQSFSGGSEIEFAA